ncbi:hypothetical protein [Marinoscillum furvescens]|uniref:Uncharacterized protein n=1 Tax=Marinoscillum furvescens DSM 4134 TaxID=1122208 RepID=A0A3D9LGS9_MARFU|nr:hypothetical protein [Marinoscillum furvescens]REE05807.1 hypothetical protein C7460_101326 [Marinoscillum furvescens DSM 4134]
MSQSYNNWEQYYHQVNVVFHGVIAASLIPFAYAFLETQKQFPDAPMVEGELLTVVKFALVVLAGGLLALAQMQRPKLIAKVREVDGLQPRLKAYLRKMLIYYMVLETAAVVAFVGLLVSKDQLFSLIYVVVIFTFSLTRPTFDRIARETGIPEKELKEWGKGN